MAKLFRYIELDSSKIDRAARTVPVSFSSEYPAIQRDEKGNRYIEILDHSPENVDLSLLNNRGAFLDEHDDKDHIGVVEKAEISDSKTGVAILRVDSHAKAEIRLTQMESRSRPHISAGYAHTKFLGEETLPNGRKAKRFAWRALEISSVACPADPTIGVARDYKDLPEVDLTQNLNADDVFKNLTPEQKTRMKLLLDDKPGDGNGNTLTDEKVRSAVADSLKKDRNERVVRRKELRQRGDAILKDFPLADQVVRVMIDESADSDETIESVSGRMTTEASKLKPVKQFRMADLGLSEKEQKCYSILRGIQSVLRRGGRAENKPDGLEGDVHEEMVKRNIGIEYSGFLVPSDAPVRAGRGLERFQRDSQATVFGTGGATVATELVVPIIELLRNKMVTDTLGITTMSGLQGNVVIPRQTASATAYAVPEIAPLTISTQALDQIALSPHRVGAYNQYSKQLLLQSSIDVEGFIRTDLMAVIALAWDRIVLNGQGANSEPLGIIGTPGVGSLTFGAAATFANMVSFETIVASANADIGSMAYTSTPTTRGKLKSIPPSLTASTYPWSFSSIWARDNTINGYPALASNQIPNNLMVFGVWSQAILALWGGYDVVVNPYTLDINAEVRITVNTFGDVAIRHPQSFCVSADSAAQ